LERAALGSRCQDWLSDKAEGLGEPLISGDQKADAGARKFKANIHDFGREIGGRIVGFSFAIC